MAGSQCTCRSHSIPIAVEPPRLTLRAAAQNARESMKRMKDYERESKASAQLYQQLKPQVAFGDVVPLNLREERRAFLEAARLHEVGLSSTPPRDPVFRYASDEVAAKMIDSCAAPPSNRAVCVVRCLMADVCRGWTGQQPRHACGLRL